MADLKFTWIETHKDIVNFLLLHQNQQKELIELLKSVGITIFTDIDGRKFELEEIDPFNFFCYIYKYGASKRLE